MALSIRFITDYVCPYCVAAKKPLLEAIEEIKATNHEEIEILWHPMELTEEPAPRIDTYHDEERKQRWAKTLVPICKELGIEMKLPPHVIPRPYTRLAWEGFYFAKEHGVSDAYSDRLYEAYFMDELDIGDPNVLISLAKELGLDTHQFEQALVNGIYTATVKENVRHAKEILKVTSVPTIYIGEQKIDGAIYSKEEFKKLILKALEENKEEVPEDIHGMCCGIDGCH